MRKTTCAAAAIGFLTLNFPASAIYQEPTVPQTDRSEQIPSNTIKLDQNGDKPSTEKKKTQKEVKRPEPERTPRQATRKQVKEDQPNQGGVSPETGRAIGTMIDIGIGVGVGMGSRGGEHGMMGGDRGMRDR